MQNNPKKKTRQGTLKGYPNLVFLLKMKKQNQYKVFERHGQLGLALNSEIIIPQSAPVRLLSAQLGEMEYGKLYKAYSTAPCVPGAASEMEYGKLYKAYSPRGRKTAAEPRVLFKAMLHEYLCGIYSSQQPEEARQYRIDFR